MTDISFKSSGTLITHIVLFKYRPNITWTDLQDHFDVFLKLKERCLNREGRSYMLSMRAGKNQSWESYSKGMTHGFVLEFSNQQDLDYYLTEDPVHRAFSVAAKPLIEDSVVVDIHNGVLFGPTPQAPLTRVYEGSCHCGNIKWTAKIENAQHILCHCDTCKKLGGGPFSLNAIIARSELNITQGEPKDYTYLGASGKQVHCYHCGNCTSHVYHHQEVMGGDIIVRTILLDGGKEMSVGGEIFGEGRLGWVNDLKGALLS